ncbi:hypothetical protein [Vibrio parahaemolyticus]|uniref:capsular polysaccharide export protein, LipB/KpsS family n=2 Tax=Vibrio parahaemolyticus TaxID=670 RepID=UPI0010370F2D|nr:hypothetical protein [Vibrio parahaemolyticus]EJG1064223.1 hypothetical protein [Vibrio parahaemolyticus O1]EGR2045976.1 hypothetical protein [Vibrio parahaemolyticus]EHH2482013.1 hypothetical protein [Vibrio parahaemolyticus]EIV8504084.1 hypothetical protein [Vibrio parahaemolyticus]EIZ1045663.1 hypothetical protein [Vibrio parahaemolyticus]
MRKIVCFDPPYSHYFNDLTLSIEKCLGQRLEKECVTFNSANKLYLPNFSLFKPKVGKSSDKDLYRYDFVTKIPSLSNVNGEVTCNELARKHIEVYISIEKYIKNNLNAIYLIYNDLRWNHAFAIDILKKNNCTFFVFERGVFRPYSTTMDTIGVNANSKLRNTRVTEICSEKSETLDRVFFKNRVERTVKFNFVKYFIASKFAAALQPKSVKAVAKSRYRKNLKDYVKLQFSSSKVKSKNQNDIKLDLADITYVFVPLQLSNDTQTLINSDFSSTQEFINKIVEDFRASKLYGEAELVFKQHPLDTSLYNFPNDVLVSSLPTEQLIEHCEFCITINSTVGFEALFKKRVLCLGRSFYTEHGFVGYVDKHMNAIDANFEQRCAKNYKYFVLDNYQVPGSIFNYTGEDLEYTANKILTLSNI